MHSRVSSYTVSPARLATLSEPRLSMMASDIHVAGVARDLIELVRQEQPIDTKILLARFPLPPLLTFAFVRKGLEQGVFKKKPEGLVCAAPPAAERSALQEGPARLCHDVNTATRVLCIDLPEVAATLAAAQAPALMHVRTSDDIASPAVELPGGVSDWFSLRGAHFGAFQAVFLALEADLVAAQLDTLRANLAPYASAYVALPETADAATEQELHTAVKAQLWPTDEVSWQDRRWWRAVCYPELFGPTYFLDVYARR